MLGKSKRKELGEGLRGIFAAPDRQTALDLAERLADRWRQSHPKVAEHLEEHVEECLSCLYFPESHRRRIRTTNGLERLNQEIKRRTTVVRIFPNREACVPAPGDGVGDGAERGVWVTGRRYLDMEELKDHKRVEEREGVSLP